ncbi:hypothetical protein Sjap_007431 [Stephania japonica]|uniref:Pectinesterase n=1 Tax=Stephania japonica TaxID=461633 RepID=A0AAP0PAE5_9MAGN
MSLNYTFLIPFLILLPPIVQSLSTSTTILSHTKDHTLHSIIQQLCINVENPELCLSNINTERKQMPSMKHAPSSIIKAGLKSTMKEVQKTIDYINRFTALSINQREQIAIQDCMELLDYSVTELGWAVEDMERVQNGSSSTHHQGNLKAWLSAALGNQDTCIEGFEGTPGHVENNIKASLNQVTQLISNVLTMYTSLHSVPERPFHRRNNNRRNRTRGGNFPEWISKEDAELAMSAVDARGMHFDAVVALDGSGRFQSIVDAVNEAPNYSTRRYVIYVKRGVYKENVELKKKKMNIMLVGDGMGETIISSDRNFMQGLTTFRTATFAVSGKGFIARDITFRNTAGPWNHQAVALRVDSDHSAFFRCSIEGYQDTLYAHSLRQFYRECSIYGTIDYIFGNGAAVLQNCKIFTRKPLWFQKVTITAQGRKFSNQNTGFSIQNSYVYATEPTYLGRPWKLYSRTVFMQTYMSNMVQPSGWLEWFENFALNTLYYGEYRNYGPGAALAGRVKWPGYHMLRDATTASFFTVGRFLDGMSWLPATGVTFQAGLST